MSDRNMSEMEIELDMAPPLSFEGHADDEDLIDYDIDTTEQHQLPTVPTSDEDQHVQDSLPDAPTDVSMNLDAKFGGQIGEADHLRILEIGNMPDGRDDMNIDGVFERDDDTANRQQSPENLLLAGRDIFDEANDGTADTTQLATIQTQPLDDEINYEEYENENGFAADESLEQYQLESSTREAESKIDEDAGEQDANIASTRATTETSLAVQGKEAPGMTAVPDAEPDSESIHWEQQNIPDARYPSGAQNAHQTVVGDVHGKAHEKDFLNSETRSDVGEDQDPESQKPDFHETDAVTDKHDDSEAVESGEAHSTHGSEALQDPPPAESGNFPAITVQYKGDEFPFFSMEKSAGFFSDHAVLDYNMASLLAGLRTELSDEVAAADDLVFQIDELGLEFVESHLRDAVSSTTLRQILEIFDVLVKNQDPDGSRTLYTYLFTKPNTSKRLELLIDSAAAGKGLDEIIHLFETPAPQSAASLDIARGIMGFSEAIDDYESSPITNDDQDDKIIHDEIDDADEPASHGENLGTHYEDEEESLREVEHEIGEENEGEEVEEEEGESEEQVEEEEEEGEEEDEKEEQEEHENEDHNKAQNYEDEDEENEEGDEGSEEENEEEEKEAREEDRGPDLTDDVKPNADRYGASVDDVYEYVEDSIGEDHDQDEDAQENYDENVEVLTAEFEEQTEQYGGTAGIAHTGDELIITADTNDLPGNNSNLFTASQLNQPGGENASEYDGEDSLSAGEQFEDRNNNSSVANSISTNTLADEGETVFHPEDTIIGELMGHEVLEEVLIDDDELAEIDWRDEPTLDDSTGTDILLGTSKRARPDDDAGLEEEQDVKRRRS